MRARVTEEGLLIPKDLLDGIEEVEIRREQAILVIVPVSEDDPILQLGQNPITDVISDASTNHDCYLYQNV